MAVDILAAVDETDATDLIHSAEATLGTRSISGSSSLGPFTASYGASATFSGGTVTLATPDVVRISNCVLNYSLSFDFAVDLNKILPKICLPQVCISIPFVGDVCTPAICLSWPVINIPVNYSDSLTFTADFKIVAHLSGGNWLIDVVVVGIPSLSLSATASGLLVALGLAISAALLPIPLIGPFLAAAVAAIAALIGIAGVTGWLGPILTPFVSGLSFNVYKQPQSLTIVPAGGPIDPPVKVTINALTAAVQATDKNEFVVTADV